MLILSEYADCPYRAIGKQAQYCGGGGGTQVYLDTFETANGWTTNASSTDTATTGQWVRGDPAATTSSGAKQLGTTVSGDERPRDRGGGRRGGGRLRRRRRRDEHPVAGDHLPASGTLTLSLSYYLAHGSNSSSADFFRVSVVNGSGTTTQLLNVAGAASNRNGAWTVANLNLSAYAGQSVRILVEAADASTASLVEAGVDDVRITQS